MDLSKIGGFMASMVQMKQSIDLKMNEVLEKANEEAGSPLGVSFEFSKPSELMTKLTQLENENPEKFKELMQDISDLLKKAFEETAATGGTSTKSDESSFLSMLSEKFATAAKTGDVASLQMTGKGGGGQAAGIGGSSAATTCAACGASIPEGSTECSKCGTPVQDMSAIMNLGKNKLDSILTKVISEANEANGSPLGDISGLSPKEIMDKIKELQESDPEAFKSLMNSISEGLKTASESASTSSTASAGGMESKMLADLASRFADAAETGDLTMLPPPPPPPMGASAMNPQIAQYLSDSSSGMQKTLLEILTSKSDSNGNDPLGAVRDLLLKALEAQAPATAKA